MRISSGTASAGWVSLSWIATLSGSAFQSAFALAEAPYQVGQRAGDQKIFLHEAEPLTHARRVVGIEHAGHRFRGELRRQRADEFAGAEDLKIEAAGGCRGPQPQRVDRLAAVADDRTIERHAEQARRTAGYRPQTAALHLERRAEPDLDRLLRSRNFPRIRMPQPVVRLFALPAVLDRLLEDAVFVAQPVPHRRKLHRRHRIEKAGGEPAEPAIAEPGVGLLLEDREPVELLFVKEAARDRVEAQVQDVVGQRAPDQELHRQVIDPFRVLAVVGVLGSVPALREDIPHRVRHGLVPLARPDIGGIENGVEHQVPLVKRVAAAGEFDRTAAVLLQQLRRDGLVRPACDRLRLVVVHDFASPWPAASPGGERPDSFLRVSDAAEPYTAIGPFQTFTAGTPR